jgi:DNA repair exonuclease SbcCD ATPase subunit
VKLQRLTVNNFRSYEKGIIEFSSEQNYIFGRNWQGKTSVMDAIGFALFGKRAFPTRIVGSAVKAEHLVHEGADKGFVELTFEHNAKQYILRRECPRENSSLTSEGRTLGSTSVTVREALQELLGLDDDLFVNVFYSEQDELRKVLSITPEERKVFIESILGFEYLKQLKLSTKHAVDGLQNWLEGFMSGNIKTAVEMSEEIGSNVNGIRTRLEVIGKQLRPLEGIDKKKSDSNKIILEYGEKQEKLLDREATLEERKNILYDTLKKVATGKCPTCTQLIPKDLKTKLVLKFTQTMEKIDAELHAATTQLAEVEKRLEKASADAIASEGQTLQLMSLSTSRTELDTQLKTEDRRWKDLKNQVRAYENKNIVVKRINEEKAFLAELQLVIDDFRLQLRKSITSDLENGVNSFMSGFADGDFDAKLRINDEFGFDMILHDNPVPLFNLSGAARDILALSLRYALYNIASKELNFLLLDEPTHHFDEANTIKLKNALNELTEQQLVIITVHDEFFDAVGKKFIVEKNTEFNSLIRELT